MTCFDLLADPLDQQIYVAFDDWLLFLEAAFREPMYQGPSIAAMVVVVGAKETRGAVGPNRDMSLVFGSLRLPGTDSVDFFP